MKVVNWFLTLSIILFIPCKDDESVAVPEDENIQEEDLLKPNVNYFGTYNPIPLKNAYRKDPGLPVRAPAGVKKEIITSLGIL